MSRHLTSEELERYADDEVDAGALPAIEEHLRQCANCATSGLHIARMRHAIRDAMSAEEPSAALRDRIQAQIRPRSSHRAAWWTAAAAIVALAFLAVLLRPRAPSALPELVDMHVTMLASSNPVDVLSSDRHTVKPWFEGRIPFTVPVPDLAGTPFRVMGGRVVYWRATPAAYLLIGKAAHRISVFVFRDDLAPRDLHDVPSGVTTSVWRSGGLTFVAIGQVPPEDLQELSAAFAPRRSM